MLAVGPSSGPETYSKSFDSCQDANSHTAAVTAAPSYTNPCKRALPSDCPSSLGVSASDEEPVTASTLTTGTALWPAARIPTSVQN